MGLGVGGVPLSPAGVVPWWVVVVPLQSLSLLFHQPFTPRAVAREAGGMWGVVYGGGDGGGLLSAISIIGAVVPRSRGVRGGQ